MEYSIVGAFLLLTIPSFITPGPNNLMLLASGAKFGFQKTLPHGLGINIGFPLMVFVVGLGMGGVFSAFPMVKTVMKYLAALYFLWMAWNLLGLKIGEQALAARPMKFHEAVLFQWVNPKAWAMAISFIAAFVLPGEEQFASVSMVALGCLLIGPVFSILWIVSGQQLQAFLKRTKSEKYLGAILALLMLSAVVLFLI